jgi:hypothetical protein
MAPLIKASRLIKPVVEGKRRALHRIDGEPREVLPASAGGLTQPQHLRRERHPMSGGIGPNGSPGHGTSGTGSLWYMHHGNTTRLDRRLIAVNSSVQETLILLAVIANLWSMN